MPTLYVAGVAISDDIKHASPRLFEVISLAHVVIGEERKNTLKLINACCNLSDKEIYLINEHSADSDRTAALNAVLSTETSVFFSDAGTPCISDPDYKFIALCRKSGVQVKSIPGPSSITAAVSVSGIDAKSFFFAGFPPQKNPARAAFFKKAAISNETFIFMERPYALESTLRDMSFIKRPISLSINLGCADEVTLFDTPAEIMRALKQTKAPFVIVVPPQKCE